ncbi:MAG: TIGR04438 family Trp-rich protein [Rhodoferax sp.]|nr:TIGR04438 family Trp-rich protein [Rhodoferax sp.]
MYFVLLGLVFLLMKWMEFGPIATLSWLWVLSPFALAVAWWAWADSSGYTKRLAVEKEEKRKQDRVNANRANLGMVSKTTKRK